MKFISDYLHTLEWHLDCPKALRRSFLEQTRHMAEDFIQGKPDATTRELTDYLGEPQELAHGFLETLDPNVLMHYRKRKKILYRGCVAALIIALIIAGAWVAHIRALPQKVEITETLVIYAPPPES